MKKETRTQDLHERPLPPGWRWSSLSDLLVCMESGSRPKGGAVGINGGVPSISAEHMTPHGTFDFSVLRYVPRDYYDNMPRGHIRRGDILIVKDGATTGKTCFVNDSFPFDEAVVNEHVFICRADAQQMLPELLFLWLWGPQGQFGIRSSYQGAAIGGINQSFAFALQVPVPPSHQQGDMLRRLRNAFSKIAAARHALRQRLEAVEALPAALLRQVFPQPGQPLPDGWRWVRLGEVCNVVNGFGFPEVLQGRKDLPYPFIKVSDMNAPGSEITIDGAANTVDDEILRKLGAKCYPRGTVIFPKVGGALLTNKKRVLGREASFDNNIMGVIPRNIDDSFLYHWLCNVNFSDYANTQALPSIRQSLVASVEIPLPPLSEQKRIAAVLREQMACVEQARAAAEAELEAINALSAALLRRAFMGEL